MCAGEQNARRAARNIDDMLPVAIGVVAAIVVAVLVGQFRWSAGTRTLRARLEAARLPIAPKSFKREELTHTPAPVQRFFESVFAAGQPIVAAVYVEHTGTFNMGGATDRWKTFSSNQRVITRRPGFDWNARIAMAPGVPVLVHDAYVAGVGTLHASMFGLISVAKAQGTGDVAQGELMRFFAEAPWYPTALLPSQGVQWDAVDDHSARATLRDGDITLNLLFRFNSEGLIDSVRAESRAKLVAGVVTHSPWQCRFWNYATRDGMRVPLDGEAAWVSPEGLKPYFRGHITKLRYEFFE